MPIRITSTVHKSRTARTGVWFASTAVTDTDAAPADRYVLGTSGIASSFTEAIELAHSQRIALDAELMEDVHASRSARRAAMEATA